MRTIPNTDWRISHAVQVEEREAGEEETDSAGPRLPMGYIADVQTASQFCFFAVFESQIQE